MELFGCIWYIEFNMKIPPPFLCNKTVWNFLSVIEKKHGILSHGRVLPEKVWQKLFSENLLKSSLFSAKVEGNSLELKDISRLSIKKREHLEIRNLIRAAKYIKKNIHKNQKISIKFICRLHKIVLDKVDFEAGHLRNKQNAIFNAEGFVVYMPPPPEESHVLLVRLIKYINSNKHNDIPLVKSILIHFIFEKIHPFIDGNGRVGRLLIYVMLALRDSEILRAIVFEEKLNEEKASYYSCLDKNDATSFVEFMLETISDSFDDSMEKIISASRTSGELLPRRAEIFQIVKDHKLVSLDFIKRRFQNIPERSLRNDMEDLLKRGLISKLGKTKGVMYKISS